MKSLILAAIIVLTTFTVQAQITRGTGGSIGANSPSSNLNVGINTNNPSNALTVNTSTANDGIRIVQLGVGMTAGTYLRAGGTVGTANGNSREYGLQSTGTSSPEGAGAFIIKDLTAGFERLKINHNGYLSVGTFGAFQPLSKFTVHGNGLFSSVVSTPTSAAYIKGNSNYSSAINPDYTFWNNENTGMYHPSANAIAFSTMGLERMQIWSDGKVAIGNGTSPSDMLDVDGTTRVRSLPVKGATDKLVFADSMGRLRSFSIPGDATKFLAGNGAWLQLPAAGVANACQVINKVPKVVAANGNLDCSQIIDNGTYVGIGEFGTKSPFSKLNVIGNGIFIKDTLPALPIGIVSAPQIKGSNIYSSAQKPDYTFYPDDSIGMYHPQTWKLGFSTKGQSRILIDGTGQVGIGTTAPVFKVDIEITDTANDGVRVKNVSCKDAFLRLATTPNGGDYSLITTGSCNQAGGGKFQLFDNTTGKTRFVIQQGDGKVGIGAFADISPPTEALSVQGNAVFSSNLGGVGQIDDAPMIKGNHSYSTSNNPDYTYSIEQGVGMFHPATGQLGFSTLGVDRLRIDATGNIGIGLPDPNINANAKLQVDGNVYIGSGTFNLANNCNPAITTRTPAGYKLYVEEGILTEKIKVAIKTSCKWADHVFAPEYKLNSLNEVEEYINEHNHLPGVPSANELVNEGLDLGEMQAKQMEKIEELTLYMIEMNKKIERLEKENAALRSSSFNNKK